MAVKIRLQRFGKKKHPYYHIVIADSRSPRDGKFIERIGSYNPQTKPATIDIDQEKALSWLNNGAQPTDTVRAMLSYTGTLYRKHLLRGVTKGVFTQDIADQKYTEWVNNQETKISTRREYLRNELVEADKKKNEEMRQKRESRSLAAQAADAISDAAGNVAETVSDFTENAQEKIGDAVDNIKDFAENAQDKAGDMLDNAKDFAANAQEKAGDMMDDVKDAAENFIDKVKDKIQGNKEEENSAEENTEEEKKAG